MFFAGFKLNTSQDLITYVTFMLLINIKTAMKQSNITYKNYVENTI